VQFKSRGFSKVIQDMTIGEVAQKVGIRPSAIRYYERIGLLPKPQRTSGRRHYEASILQKLGVIQMAQQAGFTVAEIQTILHDFPIDTPPSVRWEALANKKLAEIDTLIKRAYAMKAFLEQALKCRCANLDECITITENVSTGELNLKTCCDDTPFVAVADISQR
jgi:MerR family redox-sensitive transcriptional activator SoxR